MAIVPSRFERKRPSFGSLKGPLETYFIFTGAGSGSTGSATWVDYPGPIDKVIVKRDTATALFVSGVAGAYKIGAVGAIQIGVQINGVDYFLGGFFFNNLSEHGLIAFNTPIASGLAAGTYTARMRWQTVTPTANADGNDPVYVRFEEGYFA